MEGSPAGQKPATYKVTMPEGAFSWGSQVIQYADAPAPEEIPGISAYEGVTPDGTVQCLLWWETTTNGRPMIVGILNYYPHDMPPWERAGNVNVWVRPSHQRQGVGTRLIRAANVLWGPIDLAQQRFTESGAALANSLADEGGRLLTNVPTTAPSSYRPAERTP